MKLTLSTVLASLLFTCRVHAVPRPQDVYTPAVLQPRHGDTWVVGERRVVEWDTSSPPQHITNPYGTIKLRKDDYTMDESLAERFSILAGSREIVVPDVAEGDNYQIVLFGDSGNWSQSFRIVKGERR
ncbi:hypothetical protein H1R20_g8441, partial [Candolleomyces eurysporus]